MIQARAKERKLATLKQNNTEVQNSAPREKSKARDELAKIAGVSHDTIEKVHEGALSLFKINIKEHEAL